MIDNNIRLNTSLLVFFLVIVFFLIMFSPFILFCALIFILLFFPFNVIGELRLLISLICYYCLFFIFFSKDYSYASAPDYLIYFQASSILKQSNFNEIFLLFPGEIGWPIIYWFINKIGFNTESINNVSFYNTLISLVIFVFWFELHALKLVDKKYQSIVTATNILFISFITLGFLQRQAISVAILLFAISNYNNKKFYIYLFLSSIFHNTSLIVGLLYKFLIKINLTKLKIFFIFLLLLFVRVFFLEFIYFFDSIGIFPGKSEFYSGLNEFKVVSFRIAMYGLLLFFFTIFLYRNIDNYMKNIIIFSSITFICFLGVNLVSERFNFIFLYCLGFFLSILLIPKYIKVLLIIDLIVLLLFVFEKFGFVNGDFMFWELYDWIGNKPFYYLDNSK